MCSVSVCVQVYDTHTLYVRLVQHESDKCKLPATIQSYYCYCGCGECTWVARSNTLRMSVRHSNGDRYESFFSKPFCQSRPLDYFHCEISHCTTGGYVESSDVFLVLRLYLVIEIT